jgi:hypothetical protein
LDALLLLVAIDVLSLKRLLDSLNVPMNTAENASLKNSDELPPAPLALELLAPNASLESPSSGPNKS